jgi:hypothetical protein
MCNKEASFVPVPVRESCPPQGKKYCRLAPPLCSEFDVNFGLQARKAINNNIQSLYHSNENVIFFTVRLFKRKIAFYIYQQWTANRKSTWTSFPFQIGKN